MFDDLARQVAALLGEQYVSGDPSQFLGTLTEVHGSLVKELVHSVISNPNAEPNDTHRAIARLAVSTHAPVVSTNYDGLVERAAEAEVGPIGDRYVAPALPLGRHFDGIVYLHGALSRPPSELVVTDEDFGRAYLTEGWARRFAQQLFTNWTVLFIGYSHKDVVMTYLARGLPPSTDRYVLTDEPGSDRWRSLKITPIEYPPSRGHEALPRALDAWAKLESMGQLEHFARAKELASGTPPRIPEELAYLEAVISTPAGSRGFVESAVGPEWLRWIEDQEVFKVLFRPGDCDDESSRVLGEWFAIQYVADPERCSFAAGTFARLGTTISDYLHWRIAAAIPRLHKKSQDEARRWTAILSSALSTNAESGRLWFNPYLNPQTGADLLPVLRHALVPQLILTETRPWAFFPDEADEDSPQQSLSTHVEVTWPRAKDVAKKLWEVLRDDIETVAWDVLQIAEQALRSAYQLSRAFDPDGHFDSWSYGRSAIEDHPQDLHSADPSSIIDMIRDAASVVSRDGVDLTRYWLKSPYALFRRLAVHLIIENPDLDADAKSAVAAGELLYDNEVKHEIFRLLSVVAAELSSDGRGRLLMALLAGPSDGQIGGGDTSEYRTRVIFDRLEWISRHVDSWSELDSALHDIRLDNPGIGVRDHPDFDSYVTSGVWGGSLPMSIEAFIGLTLEDGASVAIQSLINRDFSERNFDDPTWDDACRLISGAAQVRPAVALKILALGAFTPLQKHSDIIGAAVNGWAKSGPPIELGKNALDLLHSLASRPELARPLSELASRAASGMVGGQNEETLEALDVIALKIWQAHAEEFELGAWSDSLMRGLNTWPGILAQYWLNRISARWQSDPDAWRGLVESEVNAVKMMLSPETAAGSTASSIFAGKLHFLFAADPDFAVESVFGLFDPELSAFAAEAWYSFLHEARTPPDLLDAGFWDIAVRARAVAAGEGRLADRYWLMLAGVAVHSTAESVNRRDLIETLTGSMGDNNLPAFLEAVAYFARDLDSTAKSEIWHSWMGDALARRLDRATLLQTPEEKAAWADLGLELKMMPLIELAATAPGPIVSRTRYSDLSAAFVRANADALIVTAHERLRVTSRIDWHVSHELGALIEAVKGAAEHRRIRDLAEYAVQRGISEALHWQDEADM